MARTSTRRGAVYVAAALAAAAVLGGCDAAREHEAVVATVCVDCHNEGERAGGLTLAGRDFGAIADEAATWEAVVRKLRGGMMPPADGPPLEPEARAALASWLEETLDDASAAAPDPGRSVPFHRLNRSEYRNVVRDLLGLDVNVAELLPADDSSYGFDNIAGVLKVSPTLLERYLAAADKISRLAVGRASAFTTIDYFRIPDDLSQEQRLPGLPLGTRGGTTIRYTFPVDGEYTIAADLARDLNESVPLYAEPQVLEISIDGERVGLFTLPAVPLADAGDSGLGNPEISQFVSRFKLSRDERAARNRIDEDWNVRVPVRAGEHEVVITFVGKTAALDESQRLPFLRPYPGGVNIPETRTGAYLRSAEISGPYNASGANSTLESRARLFVCEPEPHVEPTSAAARACASEILGGLARRAYRRPVDADDLEPLLAFYDQGAAEDGFDGGVQLALKRLLVSPELLFRVELDPPGVTAGEAYAVDALTLASRLSFFLWSSIPDDALLAAAESGALEDTGELERQVRRMIADPKADAFIENFAGQWLFLRNLDAIVPVQSTFPDFDDTLRQGLRRETELFFASIVREDRSVHELLDADYTFLNERVARHYGVTGIKGPRFRRVGLTADDPRRGLLGHGSILAVTSYPDRTSPVVRGKWILENLLGTPPPNPPPDVPSLVETDGAGSALSMRERLALHRENPTCASCHALMDPLGFALENFNAVGQWRTLERTGEPIDASGELPDGTTFDGIDGLRHALLQSDLFVTTMTEKLLTYALGRGVEHYDMPAVRRIVREATAEDDRFSRFVIGVVNSTPFRMRRAEGGV